MQSFASPFLPTPTQIMQHKTCSIIYATHFMPHLHRKGVTIGTWKIICANLWLIENHESHEFHESFFPEFVRIFLLNPLNPCEPSTTQKAKSVRALKCPPTSVRFPTIKKISGSEICVSPKAATPSHPQSGDSCEEKGSEDGWVPLPSEPFLEKNYCYFL